MSCASLELQFPSPRALEVKGLSGSDAARMEVELKLLLAPADVAAFRRLALLKQFAVSKPYSRKLRSTYFDTPALRLREHGMELRVRRAGRDWIETLKAGGHAMAGLHERQEWEARVHGPQPDLEALAARVVADSKWKKVLTAPGLARDLAPIFASAFRRTVWPLRLPQGALVELSLDQGELQQGNVREPICEVEVELKSGDPVELFDFALQLQDKLPLRVGNLSKSARGYALHARQRLSSVKAGSVELAAGMTVEQGFRAIVTHCVAQMQDNESGVMGSIDPESVHQMRIGMRRLASALRLFDKWMPLPKALRGELDWLAGGLGAARNADVLADSTLVRVAEACPTKAELLPLLQTASTIARAKRRQAAALLGSVRYSRLILGLVAWLRGSGWRQSLDDSARKALAATLGKRVRKILAKQHQKLLESGKRLGDDSPEERHHLRIAAKTTRYATEFFRRLRPAGRVKRYIKLLAALQDALGLLNDAAVADGLLRQLGKSHPELADSADFVRGFLVGRTRDEVRELAGPWTQFSAMKPP